MDLKTFGAKHKGNIPNSYHESNKRQPEEERDIIDTSINLVCASL